MINWVLQLNNSQLENSFSSLLEKHHVLSFPNQPNPNPIQSVIDRGNLRTQNVFFVEKGKTSRSQEIDDKRLQKELASSDRTGKPVKLSEDIRVMHAHALSGPRATVVHKQRQQPCSRTELWNLPSVAQLECPALCRGTDSRRRTRTTWTAGTRTA